MKFYSLIFFFLFNLYLSSNENNINFQKSIEFSSGVAISHALVLNIEDVYLYDGKIIRNYSGDDIKHGISFPTSFLFYPINFFGIGISHQFGCDFTLGASVALQEIIYTNKIKIVNKIGNFNNKNNWLLLEYGINLIGSFIKDNYRSSKNIDNFYYFSIGPSLLIGFEKLINNHFQLAVGFTFDSSNHSLKEGIYSYDRNYYDLNFGIETRFRFAFKKNISKK